MSDFDVVGVDSNILVYTLNKASVFHEQAIKLFEKLEATGVKVVVSWQNLAEFYAVVTDVRRFPKPLKPIEVAGDIKRRLDEGLFRLVFPNVDTGSVFLELIGSIKPTGQKIHDVFLAATLISNGVKTLITENAKDFSGIKGIVAVTLKE